MNSYMRKGKNKLLEWETRQIKRNLSRDEKKQRLKVKIKLE